MMALVLKRDDAEHQVCQKFEQCGHLVTVLDIEDVVIEKRVYLNCMMTAAESACLGCVLREFFAFFSQNRQI